MFIDINLAFLKRYFFHNIPQAPETYAEIVKNKNKGDFLTAMYR